jgi:hypothetical protein
MGIDETRDEQAIRSGNRGGIAGGGEARGADVLDHPAAEQDVGLLETVPRPVEQSAAPDDGHALVANRASRPAGLSFAGQ